MGLFSGIPIVGPMIDKLPGADLLNKGLDKVGMGDSKPSGLESPDKKDDKSEVVPKPPSSQGI